jgi:hypothetical protein
LIVYKYNWKRYRMHDAGKFLRTVNLSTVNCSLNHEDHEEHKEKPGEHEATSIFKLFVTQQTT